VEAIDRAIDAVEKGVSPESAVSTGLSSINSNAGSNGNDFSAKSLEYAEKEEPKYDEIRTITGVYKNKIPKSTSANKDTELELSGAAGKATGVGHGLSGVFGETKNNSDTDKGHIINDLRKNSVERFSNKVSIGARTFDVTLQEWLGDKEQQKLSQGSLNQGMNYQDELDLQEKEILSRPEMTDEIKAAHEMEKIFASAGLNAVFGSAGALLNAASDIGGNVHKSNGSLTDGLKKSAPSLSIDHVGPIKTGNKAVDFIGEFINGIIKKGMMKKKEETENNDKLE